MKARGSSDPWLSAHCLQILGHTVYCQGDGERAMSLFQDSLALMRQVEEKWNMGFGLLNLGGAAQAQGDDEAAGSAYQVHFPRTMKPGPGRPVMRVCCPEPSR